MECSICIATFNKPAWLAKTLESIFRQNPSFDFEVIVVDDGSVNGDTDNICRRYDRLKYIRIDRKPIFRNPATARNKAYKAARGRVVICQSDEVLHANLHTIYRLVTELEPNTFSIATVWNTNSQKKHMPLEQWPKITQLTGPMLKRPLFFLGALLRSDLYKAGGNDELYVAPGREDNAFANTLIYGLGLQPRYVAVEGCHVNHPRPINLHHLCIPSTIRYRERYKNCTERKESWLSPGAPWQYEPQQSLEMINDPNN